MAKITLEEALNNVEKTYKELKEISESILDPIFKSINEIIESINKNVNNLSVDQIRDSILRLQLKAFEISDIKEKSALKAELATTLQKEKVAISFNEAEGSAAVKEKLAQVEASAETVAESLYSLVADLLKTKLDQIHRMVAVLSSILLSRGQEMKFMNFGTDSEIPNTSGKQLLYENNKR